MALNTIRIVVARLATKYSFRLAPGVSPAAFDAGTLDHFTSLPGPLPLCIDFNELYVD